MYVMNKIIDRVDLYPYPSEILVYSIRILWDFFWYYRCFFFIFLRKVVLFFYFVFLQNPPLINQGFQLRLILISHPLVSLLQRSPFPLISWKLVRSIQFTVIVRSWQFDFRQARFYTWTGTLDRPGLKQSWMYGLRAKFLLCARARVLKIIKFFRKIFVAHLLFSPFSSCRL